MNVSASSLFHFTPKFEYLQGIIETGFQFRQCREKLPLSGYRNDVLARLGVVQHVHHPFVVCFVTFHFPRVKITGDNTASTLSP